MSNVIGKRIKECREKRGLTQLQLANRLRVSKSVISGAEGKRGCSKKLAIKLSEFFNKPLTFFIAADEQEFIRTYRNFDTLEIVTTKLFKADLIDFPLEDDVKEMIIEALMCDLKLMKKKKDRN